MLKIKELKKLIEAKEKENAKQEEIKELLAKAKKLGIKIETESEDKPDEHAELLKKAKELGINVDEVKPESKDEGKTELKDEKKTSELDYTELSKAIVEAVKSGNSNNDEKKYEIGL